jgi:large subunit ribosomal protein L5
MTDTLTPATATSSYVPRLKQRYADEVRDALKAELGLGNVMEVPRLSKIVVNMGVGDAVTDSKAIEGAMADLATITAQKPRLNRARKSVAAFKTREGMPLGVKTTLRGDRMWDFFDRLLTVALPRIRDFRGLSEHSFDGGGNYTFGVTEQLIFPEVNYDSVQKIRGMDITIVTTSSSDEHARALLKAYRFPFNGEHRPAAV